MIPVRVELNGQGKLATSVGKATRISRAFLNGGAGPLSNTGGAGAQDGGNSTLLPQIHNSVMVVDQIHHPQNAPNAPPTLTSVTSKNRGSSQLK